VVYVLRLHSGQLYIGSTTDLVQRILDHTAGRASRTTAIDAPIALVHLEPFDTFSHARTREAKLKRWSRAKKEALIRGDLTSLRTLACSKDRRDERPSVGARHDALGAFSLQ
jgi:predicted GIY-YIG superfamily endonuclease